MDVSGSSHILAGLMEVGILLLVRRTSLHTNSGSDGSFSGDINNGSDGEGATTLLKIGAGNQILSGDVQLAGSSAGWLDVSEGGAYSLIQVVRIYPLSTSLELPEQR